MLWPSMLPSFKDCSIWGLKQVFWSKIEEAVAVDSDGDGLVVGKPVHGVGVGGEGGGW